MPLVKEELTQDTITKFNKYEEITELFETRAYCLIQDDQFSKYFESLEVLFNNFKLAEHHFSNIHYIIGQHLFIYNTIIEKRTDALEASELLVFLQNYHLQNEELKRLYPAPVPQMLEAINRTVEFKTKSYNTAHPIKLHDVHFIAKGIYRLFREQSYVHLKEKLESYEEIPPLEIVKKLLNENQFIIDYPDKYLLAELIQDLLSYLETSDITNKYRLVFDLLFITQVFHLDSKATKDIEVLTNDSRFDSSAIIPTYKTSYIKDILKAYKIYIKRNQ